MHLLSDFLLKFIGHKQTEHLLNLNLQFGHILSLMIPLVNEFMFLSFLSIGSNFKPHLEQTNTKTQCSNEWLFILS